MKRFNLFVLCALVLFGVSGNAYVDHLTGVEIQWQFSKMPREVRDSMNQPVSLAYKDLKKAISYVRKAMHQYPSGFLKKEVSGVYFFDRWGKDFNQRVFHNQNMILQLGKISGPEMETRFHETLAEMLFTRYSDFFPLEEWKNLSKEGEILENPEDENALKIAKEFSMTSALLFMPWRIHSISETESVLNQKLALCRTFYSRISHAFSQNYFKNLRS